MSSDNLEQILELAKSQKAAKSTVSEPTDEPDNTILQTDHDEWEDNENMHAMGLTMGPTGNVNHGAMKIGHVVATKKKKFIGIHHPSGAMTAPHDNRARAAMDLMQFHHYLPHNNETSAHPGAVKLSSPLDEVVALAAVKSKSKGSPKPYGPVEYGDPKNGKFPLDPDHIHAALGYIDHEDVKKKYPLNGVTWASVKARIVSAAKKQGIKVSDSK
jgi:hypothetical protein